MLVGGSGGKAVDRGFRGRKGMRNVSVWKGRKQTSPIRPYCIIIPRIKKQGLDLQIWYYPSRKHKQELQSNINLGGVRALDTCYSSLKLNGRVDW